MTGQFSRRTTATIAVEHAKDRRRGFIWLTDMDLSVGMIEWLLCTTTVSEGGVGGTAEMRGDGGDVRGRQGAEGTR